jgi:hypothetical protein
MDGLTRRSFSLRALRFALVSCAILTGGAMLSSAQASAAGGEPTIAGESATSITEHSATLEAQINPEGLETAYEFWIESANCQSGSCNSISVDPVSHGYIAAGSTYQTVRVELSDLQPNYSYIYWVFAANSAGWTKGSGKEFRAVNPGGGSKGGSPLPEPENTGTPFERPAESWIGKTAAEGAAIEQAKYEEARKARESAANQPLAAVPLPKGEWCGEEGVSCEGDEVAPGGVSLTGATLLVQGDGTALVKLECSGSGTCAGKLALSAKTTSKAKGKKERSRAITIGTATFSIAAGGTTTVKIALNGAGRASLGTAHGRLAARLTVLELASVPLQTHTENVQLVQQKTAKTRTLKK